MKAMKYDECIPDVCARKGLSESEARTMLLALERAEERYFGLGAPDPSTVDRSWIEAKRAAYADVQQLRSTLWDLNT